MSDLRLLGPTAAATMAAAADDADEAVELE